MLNQPSYSFSAKVWQTDSVMGAWHFISLPQTMAIEIREALKSEEEGWGRLKATAQIGNTQWKTAIWFDTKQKTYLLPIKAEIRKKEQVKADQEREVAIWI